MSSAVTSVVSPALAVGAVVAAPAIADADEGENPWLRIRRLGREFAQSVMDFGGAGLAATIYATDAHTNREPTFFEIGAHSTADDAGLYELHARYRHLQMLSAAIDEEYDAVRSELVLPPEPVKPEPSPELRAAYRAEVNALTIKEIMQGCGPASAAMAALSKQHDEAFAVWEDEVARLRKASGLSASVDASNDAGAKAVDVLNEMIAFPCQTMAGVLFKISLYPRETSFSDDLLAAVADDLRRQFPTI